MDILSPILQQCALCASEFAGGNSLCPSCIQDLYSPINSCHRCALPLQSHTQHLVCGECQQTPPPFQQTLAAFDFRQPLQHLVHQIKFAAQEQLAISLGQLMAQRLATKIQQLPEAIIPVPLHRKRWRQRGFNQSLILARQLGRYFNIPVLDKAVVRRRYTLAQAELNQQQRLRNVKQCFQVTQIPQVRHIALVDDVMTTGSTVRELANSLHEQDYFHVDVWLLARAQW